MREGEVYLLFDDGRDENLEHAWGLRNTHPAKLTGQMVQHGVSLRQGIKGSKIKLG